MNKNVFIKSSLRQPVRTLVILLLVGAITYVFSSHVAEYMTVLNMTEHLENYYRPIGKLDSKNWDVTEGKVLVSESPYVKFEDLQRCSSAVLDGLYNADIDGTMGQSIESYVNDVVFCGELLDKQYFTNKNTREDEYQFKFKIKKIEAGYPEYIEENGSIYVSYKPGTEDLLKDEYESIQIGEQYLTRVYYSENEIDKNASSIVRNGKAGQWFLLNKLTDNNVHFFHIDEDVVVDYSDEKLVGLKENLEVIFENQRSMSVIGTKDMSLMPDFQESSRRYYLVDGRWLNREDNLKNQKVCVVHNFFAQMRELSIGDKITLKLRDLDGRSFGYILPKVDNWKSYETAEVELEIVGTYDVVPTGDIPMTIYSNILYIPDSIMPRDYITEMQEIVSPLFYSFALNSAEEQEAFILENQSVLENMGITVSFVDNNAENFGRSSKELKKSTRISVMIFGVTLLLTYGLTSILYLSLRRREFAIARALGIPTKIIVRQVGVTVGGIGFSGIAIGSVTAWNKTIAKAEELLKDFTTPENIKDNYALPTFWLFLLAVFLLLIFLISMFIGLFYMAKHPVLELLQGGVRGEEDNSQRMGSQPESMVNEDQILENQILEDQILEGKDRFMDSFNSATELIHKEIGKRTGIKVLAFVRYVYYHMTRSLVKSIMMLVVTIGFIIALCSLYWTIQQNEVELKRLYNTTVIEGEIIKNNSGMLDFNKGGGFIEPHVVNGIKDSGLVSEMYLEETAIVDNLIGISLDGTFNFDAVFSQVPILSFEVWEQFLNETGKGIKIDFLQGYDEKTSKWEDSEMRTVILPEKRMLELGEQIGDMICLQVGTEYTGFTIIGSYQGNLPNGIMEDPIIMSTYEMRQIMKNDFNYLTVKMIFDPSRNRDLLEKEKEQKDMISEANKEGIKLKLLIWDDELHKVLEPMERNLSFLKILYPVASVVFSLLGVGLSVLLLIQRAKEAAIMRILGKPASLVRILFIAEQVILCLLGIMFGILVTIIIYDTISISILINLAFYFGGITVGAVLGSIFVTNKVPLELLQAKE